MNQKYSFDNILFTLSIIAIITITLFSVFLKIYEKSFVQVYSSDNAIEISFENFSSNGQNYDYYVKDFEDSFIYEYTADILQSDVITLDDDTLILFTPYIQSEAFEIYINDILIATQGDTVNFDSNVWLHKFNYIFDRELLDQEVNELKVVQYSRYMTGGIGNGWVIDSYSTAISYVDSYDVDIHIAIFGINIVLLVLCFVIMLSISVDQKKYAIMVSLLILMLIGNSELFVRNSLGMDYLFYKKLVVSADMYMGVFCTMLFLKILDYKVKMKIPLIIYSVCIIAIAVISQDMITYKLLYDNFLAVLMLFFILWIILSVRRLKHNKLAKVILAVSISYIVYVLVVSINDIYEFGIFPTVSTVIMPVFIVLVIAVVLSDINGEKELKEMFADKSEEFISIFNNSQVGIVETDANGVIQKANMKTAELFGYSSSNNLLNQSISIFYSSGKEFSEFQKLFYKNIRKHANIESDYRLCKFDKSKIWMTISGSAIDRNFPADLSKGIIWTFNDINTRKEAEEKLLTISRKDSLTGVNNRRYFMELGNSVFGYHERHKRPLAVLMIDIDYFKKVNDNYGHNVGDLALKCVTNLCTEMIRNHDVFGRLGGEEFVTILPETNQEDAVLIAERMRINVSKNTPNEDIPQLTISIGVCIVTDYIAFKSLEQAMKKADENLYKAKTSGRNKVQI